MIREYEPLSRHTSWRIGGPARYYVEAPSVEALREAIGWARARNVPVFVLGGGSNLLVRDQGFDGLVVRYVARDWNIDPKQRLLYATAGAPMAGTARRVSSQGWRGLEWAEGVPGTIGGAVYGNAGCYGSDIAHVLERAWMLVEDDVQEWPGERFAYAYRTSVLKEAQPRQRVYVEDGRVSVEPSPPDRQCLRPIILAAELRLEQADPTELAATIVQIASQRKDKTPWGRSCGSVFKNPVVTPGMPAVSAGQLLDQAGLKNRQIGAAEISAKHANYIINLGGATSDDVLRLIDLAHTAVLRTSGIDLELEVQII
jgi:UDP-N-acetylmuramate dehydrogenase